MPVNTTEKRFEQDIETYLLNHDYIQFKKQNDEGKWEELYHYDLDKAIYLDVLVEFIKKTQPKQWAKYERYYGDEAPQKLYRRFEDTVTNEGLIYVLRNGITDLGVKLKLCYFKPESSLNELSQELYDSNILGCTRQFRYSKNNNNTIDMVLSLNGIPLVAIELKDQFKGQDVNNAIMQFKTDRDPKEFCFKLNHRFLVYFAVDLYDVYMTTQLKGNNTYFLPFNQGSNGAGNPGGKGNPANENGYATSYLWERVLSKDSLLDIVHRFMSYVVETVDDKKIKKLIFPRYHQYDVVKKIVADVKNNGAGTDYLIQHSAGSGKSNSIAWLAYRLASLHDNNDNPVYSTVIVVTNRVVLDSQLQDTINSFDHVPGLVEAITKEKRSKGLIEAINDKKRIVICTVQKFLYAYEDFKEMDGRRFAVIVDEAHQGQSGESAKTLKKSLIDKKQAISEYAEEEDVNVEDVDYENEVVKNILAQGKHKNQSFFAFTATPTNKTIELFGTYNPFIGKKEPFHVYSMKQAIEEGFILDVLANVVGIKSAFKIIKTSEDNPELFEGPASKALVRYYKQHHHTIQQKTEMIMTNFLNYGRFKIGGKGKAMVIADSRPNAVRYYLAIKEYIKNHPDECKGCNVLVAFSGPVKLDGVEYEEAKINVDLECKPINSDKKFRKAFRSNDFNIMVVANKYQTGFDEPLLHSMYVDKRLRKVNAVQTLSRLNRTCPGKEDTFVLDFENTEKDIKESFQPFYEETLLDGSTDYNYIYDLRTRISKYLVYNQQDIDTYNKIMSDNSKNQDAAAQGRLSSFILPICNRYNDLDKKEKKEFRDYVRKFNKNYSYITQLIRLHDDELYKEFVFTSHLIKFLPKDKVKVEQFVDMIKLQYSSLKESFKGAIILENKTVDLKPSSNINPVVVDPKKDTLQRIIDKVNERFNGQFTEGDMVIVEGIFQMFMKDAEIKKYKRYAKDNNTEMFVNSLFPDKFREIVTKCFLENNDSFNKLFNDPDFYGKVMDAMARELYKELRKD